MDIELNSTSMNAPAQHASFIPLRFLSRSEDVGEATPRRWEPGHVTWNAQQHQQHSTAAQRDCAV